MLDRALQRQILEALASRYPEGLVDLPSALEPSGETAPAERAVLVNTQYLAEHGLVSSGYRRRGTLSDDSFIATSETVITAQGLDFLADDGGLGAILGTVTVRLDAGTLETLLAAHVEASTMPDTEKSRIKAALQSLGREAWSEAAKRLVTEGLDRWPQALEWLQTLRG